MDDDNWREHRWVGNLNEPLPYMCRACGLLTDKPEQFGCPGSGAGRRIRRLLVPVYRLLVRSARPTEDK